MNIYGEKVLLRAMEPEDMEMLRETVNDPEIERMVGGWSFPVSKYEQMQWYERVVSDKKNLRFIIQLLDSGESIGMINLVDIDWKNRTGFVGIKLKSNAPKRSGFALDAVMALERYAFEQLQLSRLDGNWLTYNIASRNLFEKCGFKVEGTRRQSVYKDGCYYDQHHAGVLREDYLEAKRQLGWKAYEEN